MSELYGEIDLPLRYSALFHDDIINDMPYAERHKKAEVFAL